LKEEALDRIMWRARFGRGFGPVVRQNTKWMNRADDRTATAKYSIVSVGGAYSNECALNV
jgi:hypothetical protein